MYAFAFGFVATRSIMSIIEAVCDEDGAMCRLLHLVDAVFLCF